MTFVMNSSASDKVSSTTDIRARISVDRGARHGADGGQNYSVVIPDIPRHGIPLSMLSRASADRAPGCVGDNHQGRHLGSPAASTRTPANSSQLPVFLGSTTPTQPPLQPQHTPQVTNIIQQPMMQPQMQAQMQPQMQLMQPVYQPSPYQQTQQPMPPVHPIAVPGALQMQYVPQQIHHHHHAPQPQQAPLPQQRYVPAPPSAAQRQSHVYPSLGAQAPRYSTGSMTGDSTMGGPPGYRSLAPRGSEYTDEEMMRDSRLKQHGFQTASDTAPFSQPSDITYTSDNVSSAMIS